MELLSKPTDQFLADKQRYFSKNCVVEEFNTHSAKIHTIGWNCNGKKLASGSCDKTITIFGFDRERFKKENTLKGHSESVDQLCWHPLNADLLSSASCDKTVKIWDTKSILNFEQSNSYPDLKPYKTLQAHPSNCISIEFDPTGKYFVTGSADALVSLWDLEELICVRALVETGESIHELSCPGSTFTLAWHPSKYVLAYSCGDRDKNEKEIGSVRLFGVFQS
ncbi:hypothetical protein HZS_3869 [Henneguya salminicola]|nr:hypothetical protein HZS_3869 [Henneguya salminicola]